MVTSVVLVALPTTAFRFGGVVVRGDESLPAAVVLDSCDGVLGGGLLSEAVGGLVEEVSGTVLEGVGDFVALLLPFVEAALFVSATVLEVLVLELVVAGVLEVTVLGLAAVAHAVVELPVR